MEQQCTLVELPSVDSTNTYVKEHFRELPDAALVYAIEQRAGRGRRDRVWYAPPGTNFTGTMLMKTPEQPLQSGYVPGLAALEVLRGFAPEQDFYLKWPNDVYTGDEKIAGILCEGCGFQDGKITAIAAGLGINLNMDEAALAAIENGKGTSLKKLTAKTFSLRKVAERLAKSLFRYYSIHKSDSIGLVRLWEKENRLVGETVTLILDSGERLSGRFRAIAPDGSLELETAGTLRRFSCADVQVDRTAIDFERLKHKRFS